MYVATYVLDVCFSTDRRKARREERRARSVLSRGVWVLTRGEGVSAH